VKNYFKCLLHVQRKKADLARIRHSVTALVLIHKDRSKYLQWWMWWPLLACSPLY